jgi:hypothetical protein
LRIKAQGYPKWPNLFNAVIESLDLREIVMTSRQYTWAGPGDNPTFEKHMIVESW